MDTVLDFFGTKVLSLVKIPFTCRSMKEVTSRIYTFRLSTTPNHSMFFSSPNFKFFSITLFISTRVLVSEINPRSFVYLTNNFHSGRSNFSLIKFGPALVSHTSITRYMVVT